MTNRTCSYPGCDKPHEARGLCAGHYRLQRRGEPLRPLSHSKTQDPVVGYEMRVVRQEGCWGWNGYVSADGYGKVSNYYAHRISYEMHKGPIPAGLFVRHLCNNPICTNPDHLEVGTQLDNMADMVKARRHWRHVTP